MKGTRASILLLLLVGAALLVVALVFGLPLAVTVSGLALVAGILIGLVLSGIKSKERRKTGSACRKK